MNITSLVAGLVHPLGGMDHILAMVAIGVWGVVAGGRALWIWPVAFVSTLLVGFAAGIAGLHVPLVEPMIAASVVALGLLIAFAVQAPVWLGALIAGLFACFHGHAHGTAALTAGFAPVAYASGFALTTAALHTVGLGAGYLIARTAGASFVRAAGALVATGGVALMAPLAGTAFLVAR